METLVPQSYLKQSLRYIENKSFLSMVTKKVDVHIGPKSKQQPHEDKIPLGFYRGGTLLL
jgi:hypothetical protein